MLKMPTYGVQKTRLRPLSHEATMMRATPPSRRWPRVDIVFDYNTFVYNAI